MTVERLLTGEGPGRANEELVAPTGFEPVFSD